MFQNFSFLAEKIIYLFISFTDSTIPELPELMEKCEEFFSEHRKVLDDIESAESDLCKHIVYRDPNPPTPASPAKSAPKGKDKKGKDKTPEPIDPVLQVSAI